MILNFIKFSINLSINCHKELMIQCVLMYERFSLYILSMIKGINYLMILIYYFEEKDALYGNSSLFH